MHLIQKTLTGTGEAARISLIEKHELQFYQVLTRESLEPRDNRSVLVLIIALEFPSDQSLSPYLP